MFTAELDVALSKLRGTLEIGDKFAVLYAVSEGLFSLGYLSKEDRDLHVKRYSEKLVDVRNRKRERRENSHVPVMTLEQRKEKELLDQKDRQFKGMLEQWEIPRDLNWQIKAVSEAQKFKEKLQSARDLIAKAEDKTAIVQ
jgi:hypothetical protein